VRVLIVKLSSLGDVVHTMPAVQDIRACVPQARIDWVVEKGFAPLVARCEGVEASIPCELRRWSKSPLSHETRHEWRTFRKQLRSERYDAIVDLQGLTKSALIARAARTSEDGRRYAMANRTEGASYEAPTRWVADVAIELDPHVHAVQRAREICSRALGYKIPPQLRFGLHAQAPVDESRNAICFVHGTSREDKCWPLMNWVLLGRRLVAQGRTIALPHGNDEERARSEWLARELGPAAQVWTRLDLGALTDRIGACAGVIGVDSGLSHIAVALDLPHVQIYNFDTAWRTGPLDAAKQRSVYAQPAPAVEAVWDAWQSVAQVAQGAAP
jgi:heptosyltransferase-1